MAAARLMFIFDRFRNTTVSHVSANQNVWPFAASVSSERSLQQFQALSDAGPAPAPQAPANDMAFSFVADEPPVSSQHSKDCKPRSLRVLLVRVQSLNKDEGRGCSELRRHHPSGFTLVLTFVGSPVLKRPGRSEMRYEKTAKVEQHCSCAPFCHDSRIMPHPDTQ